MTEPIIYEVFFACPRCPLEISWEYKTEKKPVSEADLRPILPTLDLWCESAMCGWHGKADGLRLIRIVAVGWMG
jgi:hypothetical protein